MKVRYFIILIDGLSFKIDQKVGTKLRNLKYENKESFFGKSAFLAIVVIALVFGSCDEPNNDNDNEKSPEEKTTAERWDSWAEPESGVTVTHSVADDGVVTVRVGGTAVSDWWLADARYQYTVQKYETYTYEFEAWTARGSNRTLYVQYYGGNNADNLITAGPPYLYESQVITEERKTYSITGTIIDNQATNSGVALLQFQCADQLGTFYVKVISITKQTADSISDFNYSENNSTITISSYKGAGGAVTIPSAINGKPVVSIGSEAFCDYNNGSYTGKGLTSVNIPNSVTSIGGRAFYGNQLTSVTIPNRVTTIGERAFYGNQLTSVTIGNSVTDIESGAFANNPLTNITVGSGNTAYIAKNSFLLTIDEKTLLCYYGSEKNVTIPDSVTTIGGMAFAYNQLTSVTIGANVTLTLDSSFTSFPGNFDDVYNDGGKLAGTYERTQTGTDQYDWPIYSDWSKED